MQRDLSKLSIALEHNFAIEEHLRIALRHSSLSIGGAQGSNERYEFLGDRILSLIIAEMLLEKYPDENEGDIAKRHTALVRQETLVAIAKKINLGEFIEMDDGTEATGGRDSSNILSDCCESIIAALYLDGGLSAAKKFIGIHWGSILKETTEPPKDAKTSLQEWAQGAGLPLPKYREVSKTGPAHAPLFMIEVAVHGRNPIMSSGYSKQKAEQLAAQLLLKELNNE